MAEMEERRVAVVLASGEPARQLSRSLGPCASRFPHPPQHAAYAAGLIEPGPSFPEFFVPLICTHATGNSTRSNLQDLSL